MIDGRTPGRGAAALVAALAIAIGILFTPPSVDRAQAAVTPVDDTYTVDEDQTLVVDGPGVLTNDTSDEGSLCVTGTVGADFVGSLDGVNEDGSFAYTPPADFNGTTSFGYSVAVIVDGVCTDEPLADATPTVTITVAPVNDSPIAKADSFQGLGDRTLTVAAPGILRNDADVDGDGLVALKVTDPVHGTVNLAADGGFSYTPPAGFLGADGFSYRASDGSETSPVRVVSITVTAVPTPAPSPTPTPTAPPAGTPEPSAAPTDGGSGPREETASTSVAPSADGSASPAASLAPARPVVDEGGLSIPVLVMGLLFASLLAFGGAFLAPKWLEQRRAAAGGYADDGFTDDGLADDGLADDGDPRDDPGPP